MTKLLLTLALFTGFAASAQLPTYKLEIGQSLADVLAPEDFFRYPSFREARVQFRDGYVKQAQMNLNYLLGKLEFIGPKGDTMILEGVDQLAHVAFGRDTFFFYNGSVEQVAAWKGTGRLLQHQQLQEEGSVKVGGYEANDPSASVEGVTRYNSFNQVRTLSVRQRTTFIRSSKLYYWKDDTAEPVAIDRRVIERLFPAHKKELSQYLKEHKVDYRMPQQVKGLLDYMHSLALK
ncbi:MAG: hypothetical protein EOO15_08435 [Chitinophagaceae bacterium]|nr:MAG: hypothetical protein EOO15_08435 [Chitinophagaceae bacterium]